MKTTCELCKKEFVLTPGQELFIEECKKKGMVFAMLECCACGRSFGVNPQNVEIPHIDQKPKSDWIPIRCPISRCTGHVVRLMEDVGVSYDCSECGSTWVRIESLYAEIEAIILKYSHRETCYHKQCSAWMATPVNKEPKNIDTLIEAEQEDPSNTFSRD